MDKRKIGELLAKNFETDEFREYFLDMVEQVPDYIFTMPSSTTGKYHNKTQCQPFGQLYHIFMFQSILEHLLRLKGNKERFSTKEIRDAMRCVPMFHDAVKCGWNGSQYTVQDHPVLASRWVLKSSVPHDVDSKWKQVIADMCAAHSGEWNKNRSGKEIMPEPRNEMEFLIHECDILSSRMDLDWIISDELKELLDDIPEPKPEDFIIPIGKYKGRKLGDVFNEDPDYCRWMKENVDRQPLKGMLEELYGDK
jgi:hypothetical protein